MKTVLLSTAYLPNFSWLNVFLKEPGVQIEKYENFVKQTYRNRCEILSANGKLTLSIPLIKESGKELISEKRISYAENWQIKHWRAITSAYKNSPYFEYFEQEIAPFYSQKTEFLLDFNSELLKIILHILRIKKEITFTRDFESEGNFIDFRNCISEKNEFRSPVYPQVFDIKFPFTPDLSCIDMIFNTGLETKILLSR